MFDSKQIGEIGERLAKEYLLKNSYRIISTNFRKPYGEIDIVTRLKKTLVCVEVKTSASNIKPEWQMTPHKMKKFKRIIEAYLFENNLQEIPVRADAILINLDPLSGNHTLDHIEGLEF